MTKFLATTFACLLGLTLLSAWQTPSNNDWKDKISTSLLDRLEQEEQVDFLIRLRQQADLSAAKNFKNKEAKGRYVYQQLQQLAKSSQQNLIQLLDAQEAPHRSFFVVNAIHAKGNFALIRLLAQQEEVASIENNPQVSFDRPIEEEVVADLRGGTAIEWGISMIKADSVWEMGYRGQNVVVAGQDTGYDWTHPSLQSKYRGMSDDGPVDHNYNWHDAIREINPLHGDSSTDPSLNPCGLDVKIPCDDNNHGTHTMGTIVGEDGENQIGVAPEAKWIACRNMERGYGTPATYIECYEFFLAPTDLEGENANPDMAPHVINNSWGCPELEGCNSSNWATMEAVINNLKAAGVVVVVSAGNSGRGGCETVNTPSAIYENSFSIGATASNDTIASFSSRGPVTVDGSNRMKPNVSAPGVRVRSAVRGDGYRSFSGTSMAGPHVAGAVALIISANPALAGRVDMIEDILEQTAVPKTTDEVCGTTPGTEVPNNTYGFGRIDVLEAVKLALNTQVVDTEEPLVEGNLQVFPNPTEGQLYLEMAQLKGQTQFELYAADGRLVLQSRWVLQGKDRQTVDMSALPKGIYFYRLHSDQHSLSGRVVRQ
ncbi:MAG: S8 family serine peptidase [Bacteroidota bacterium]